MDAPSNLETVVSRRRPAPVKPHLLVEWYAEAHPGRAAELATCLAANVANSALAQIHVLGRPNDLAMVPSAPNLLKIPVDQRMTFAAFIQYAGREIAGQPCVIANLDIQIDEAAAVLLSVADLRGHFLALCRWNILASDALRFFNRNNSADAWAFEAPLTIEGADFHLGKPGCDNRIAKLADEAGLRVSNPSLSLVIRHLHLSGRRNYRVSETVPDPYALVTPTRLRIEE